jgi:hypothetical protein
VSATTFNSGNGQAAASVTRYWLSTDPSISQSDILVGTAGHAVPVLAANATSTGPQLNLRFPSTVATRTYYLGACSDDDLVIIETDESDNCLAAATTVLVTNPNIMSDLVSEPVDITPLTVGPGDKVTVTDTTKNIGSAPVGSATTTRYWMSIYSTVGSKPNLLGANALTRVVPDLAAGARSKVSTLVTIPATIPRGNYFIGACSDNSGAATESNETNNCRLVPITVQ